MSVRASGGKIWSQDKVKVASSKKDDDFVFELLAIIFIALVPIIFFIIPMFQSSYGNTEKSSDKDVFHSISVETSHKPFGEDR